MSDRIQAARKENEQPTPLAEYRQPVTEAVRQQAAALRSVAADAASRYDGLRTR